MGKSYWISIFNAIFNHDYLIKCGSWDPCTRKYTLENIPPTPEALPQYAKRVLPQVGYIWGQAREPEQNTPNPSEWSWVLNEKTRVCSPKWTILEDVSQACWQLFHCNYEKACKGNCKCGKAGLRCTVLCRWETWCINNDRAYYDSRSTLVSWWTLQGMICRMWWTCTCVKYSTCCVYYSILLL